MKVQPQAQVSKKKIPSYQEHSRPEGNVFWDELHGGLGPGSHEGPGDAVCTASS